jgi:hypothetical protein
MIVQASPRGTGEAPVPQPNEISEGMIRARRRDPAVTSADTPGSYS